MARRLNAELLKDALKKRWENGNHQMVCDINNPNIKGEKSRKYYFEKLDDNLVNPMSQEDINDYGGGAGQELKWKMKAIHSSSAMTYNIFSNSSKCGSGRKVKIVPSDKLPEGEFNLKYEKKLPAINSPANLDVYLLSDENILLFEMKMTEWILGQPKKLKAAYLENVNNYPDEKFRKVMQELMQNYIPEGKRIPGKKEYSCKTKHFDAFQVMLHIFSIYKAIHANKYHEKLRDDYKLPTKPKNIILVIGYWTVPNDNTFLKEAKIDYETYKKDIEGSDENPKENTMRYEIKKFTETLKELKIKDLFWDKYEVTFDVKALTVKEIVDCLDKKENDLNALMKRYL